MDYARGRRRVVSVVGIIAELGRLRCAGEHQAGTPKTRHQLGIGVGDKALDEFRAHLAPHTLSMQYKFLDHERHTGEWATRKTGANFRRGSRKGVQHGVDLRIDLGHSLERGGSEFVGRHFFAGDQVRQSEPIVRRCNL